MDLRRQRPSIAPGSALLRELISGLTDRSLPRAAMRKHETPPTLFEVSAAFAFLFARSTPGMELSGCLGVGMPPGCVRRVATGAHGRTIRRCHRISTIRSGHLWLRLGHSPGLGLRLDWRSLLSICHPDTNASQDGYAKCNPLHHHVLQK
jgi:hypothetical protein